ncbi:MAG: helix-turn-helix domain-containing protein, partial [Alphaproteobacteria bacterium]
STLEKKAGIRPSSLQNILQGRSKNPSIEILQLAASALNCTVSELLGEQNQYPELSQLQNKSSWDQQTYLYVIEQAAKVCRIHEIPLSKLEFLKGVEQIYTYSQSYQKNKLDADLIDWMLRRSAQDFKTP